MTECKHKFSDGGIDWEWYLLSNRKKKQLAIKAGVSPSNAHDLVYGYGAQNDWQGVLYNNDNRHMIDGQKIFKYFEEHDMLFPSNECRKCKKIISVELQQITKSFEFLKGVLK
tara:strand:- start:742 stop:1080 length:339 start_codon:yes stop_codon:yes gene_type:complete